MGQEHLEEPKSITSCSAEKEPVEKKVLWNTGGMIREDVYLRKMWKN